MGDNDRVKVLNPGFDLRTFFGRVASAPQRLLLLDYDGTLAPFRKRPEDAVPYAGIPEILTRAARDGWSRVAIVSGRRLADLRGPLSRIPCEEAWGTHGWERLESDGARVEFVPAPTARRQLQVAEPKARRLAMFGARVERKRASVAVHWRGLPEANATAVRESLSSAWRDPGSELDLLEFDGGVELRARGRTKGDAVREALASCDPNCACAYLGDDLTDEDAFAAIEGRGAAVLVRPQLRETRADLWLRPPEELLAFLYRWCAREAR